MTLSPLPDLLTEQLQRDLKQFERNSKFAEDHWQEFIDEHEGHWVIVFDEQQKLFGHDVQELVGRIPPETRDTAVLLFLEEAPAALFL